MRLSAPSLHIGGVVAIGFDASQRYMLVVSHDGRGVFELATWKRVARENELAYPNAGLAIGIGPIAGERIPVKEIDYSNGRLISCTPDGRFELDYESGILAITATSTSS